MAEVGGMLASAALRVATQKLASAMGDRAMLQWSFDRDLEGMKTTLESVAAVLEDAERRSIRDAAARLWLKRLKAAAYNVSDLLDEFHARAERASRKMTVLMPYRTIIPKITMANKMKVLREELNEITNQHKNFRFMPDNTSNQQHVTDKRATSSKVEEALILGRNQDKQKVMALLSDNITQGTTILPIYGIGGIGKTTLAKMVLNDTQFKDYSRVWVYVSQMFDLNKIGNSIISEVLNCESQITEPDRINRCLDELLAGRKVLIILDDMWENDQFELDKLMLMLNAGKGSKVTVIITTRDEEIAKKVCTIEPYKLGLLTDDMCWTVIKQKCNFEARIDKELLEDIGRDISMKCGGVPLAAQALGYMLQSMKFDEWVSVRNSDIWTESTLADTTSPHHKVLASLLLSYSNLLPDLRLCFVYCAIFPKGHKLVKVDLIHQWIALGFVERSSLFSTRQLGENYVSQLVGMSFLQHSRSPSSSGLHDEDATLLTMHDLVHDVARSIMADELLDSSTKSKIQRTSCRYALLKDCSKPLKLFVTFPSQIRALHFLDCGNIKLHGAAFSSAKWLRVLDLSACSIKNFPSSIGQLKHLRYLNAPGIQDRNILSIVKLSKLYFLNLSGSARITALPKSIGEIEGLVHLDLSGCLGIRELPESFCKLTNLIHLNLSDCYHIEGVSEAMSNLTELQYLNLSHCSSYKGRLHLKGLREILGNLTKLRYLNLSKCIDTIFGSAPTDQSCRFIECVGTLCNLEHLDLSKNNSLNSVPESLGRLRMLHTINLSGCCNLMQLPKSIGEIDSLKFLTVTDCRALDKSTLPCFSNNLILLPHFVVQASDSESSSNIGLLQDANPTELKISSLENVKSAEETLGIKLSEKRRISKLIFQWSTSARRFMEDIDVLRDLLPPSTLQHFDLQGYKSISFPGWLMNISHYVPNIVKIKLEDLPMCNILPALGQLQNLQELFLGTMSSITKIDGDFCGCVRAFPQLVKFTLYYMKSLEEWTTTYSYGEDFVNEMMFPKLQRLEIRNCPKLKLKPCPPKTVDWKIESSDNVISSWGAGCTDTYSSSSPVTNLEVDSCKVPLCQWRLLQHLPVLPFLSINRCNDLTSLPDINRDPSIELLSPQDISEMAAPKYLCELTSRKLKVNVSQEIIRRPISLQSLRLSNCASITSLPQWLGDITSLEKLEIFNCGGIGSLPQNIEKFNNLKYLHIFGCPRLKVWCQYKEHKMWLRHVEKVQCVDTGKHLLTMIGRSYGNSSSRSRKYREADDIILNITLS